MTLDPLPDDDGEEPDGFPLPPGAEEDDLEDFSEGLKQGLYICLPQDQVALAGFLQNGQADTMAPGPLLATIVDTVTGDDGQGLAGCSEDQLVGIISAARRQEARDAWILMTAMAEFAARHADGTVEDHFAADELAAELHLTPLSAADQMHYSTVVRTRLPETFAALRAGRIHPVHVRIIEDETRVLSDEDAAKADQVLAAAAPGMTFGELRAAAHKLLLQLDPEAAKKRKEAARAQAHVRPFRERSGNAGMVARELPSDEVLASFQHVEQRALDLRAAGLPGSMRELRIRAYLDLLQERDSRDLLAAPDANPGTPADPVAEPDGARDQQPLDDDPPDTDPDGRSGPGGPGHGSGGHGPAPGSTPPSGSGSRSGLGTASGPSVAALITITVPWSTYTGQSETPGQAGGLGPLDGDDTRDLIAAAARHPRTRWCVTGLNPDGTAAAHACLSGRHPPPGTGPPGSLPILNTPLIPVARGPCDHAHGETGYHPTRKLQHLIRARSATCTAPGCRRAATRCDLDHTQPWDQGGATCECNLAPLCRHHHRVKQAEGWQLEQPEPGVLIWRTPSGRRYSTTPTAYGSSVR